MKKPFRPCAKIGCPNLTRERYCEEHKRNTNDYDKYRGSAAKRGYDSKWRKARKVYLLKHPFCVECMKEGVYTPATVVDHIIPHKGDKKLFWDQTNWQPLCEMHHNRKTASQDMGGWSTYPRL
ncbi:HNH endonuclease signature motif containing protein [Bacillus smithii]|uniref:HNH endonuclease signature motif containing protein n=1 Tax=Bacillus smithii TaxID=1479 RepID=UPI002E1AF996|nr:HNH endonuclease signature motif containing protein [Bacillus smithii]MED1456645.1 HNH endonuclease signature motif containing protein [Bacillus smithii]